MPQTPSAAPTPASPLEQTAPQGLAVTNTDVIVPAQLAATQAGDATPPPALDQTLRGAAGGPVGAPPKIGRFSVLRVLGEGGMGVVYAAYDEDLDRKVAIKVLRDSMHGGAQGRPRILREAQAMARLSHPNVVQVYDVGEHDGLIFVAMEFVKGRTLTRWLDERERPWQEVRDMFVQAGRGLAAAHAEGIVHRDFKPDSGLAT